VLAVVSARRRDADVFTRVRLWRTVSVHLVGNLSAILPIRQEITAWQK
jgi:hypothetical protein